MGSNVRWFYVSDANTKKVFGRYLRGGYVTGRARGKTYSPNGARECARRRRQMERANVQG